MPTVTLALDKFGQTPDERKRYTFDYAQWVDTGETISSATSEISPATSPALSVTGLSVANNKATFFISGGKNGQTYKVLITSTFNSGQIKQDCIFVKIKDFTP